MSDWCMVTDRPDMRKPSFRSMSLGRDFRSIYKRQIRLLVLREGIRSVCCGSAQVDFEIGQRAILLQNEYLGYVQVRRTQQIELALKVKEQ
jgi:hypothetical protein